ncbi:helix-turn-helix transcriptional regulator, partial [Variovorax sp. CT11-76]
PGLTAEAVARELGISQRSLHRCLADGGATFAATLLDCRMQAARRMLGDARFDRLAVAEIGFRCGLADASHFVRLCRQQLGATPGALRLARIGHRAGG